MSLRTVYEKIHVETSVQLSSANLVLLKYLADRSGFNDILYIFLWHIILKCYRETHANLFLLQVFWIRKYKVNKSHCHTQYSRFNSVEYKFLNSPQGAPSIRGSLEKVMLFTKYYIIIDAYTYLVYSNLFRKVSWTKAKFNQSRDHLSSFLTQQSCLPWCLFMALASLPSAATFIALNWSGNVFFGKGNSHKSLERTSKTA